MSESSLVHRGTDDVSVAQLIEEYRLRDQTAETKVRHYDGASLSSTVIDWLTAQNLRVMITSTMGAGSADTWDCWHQCGAR